MTLNSTDRQRLLRVQIIEGLGALCDGCGYQDIRALEIVCTDPFETDLGRGLGYYYRVMRELNSGTWKVLCCNCNAVRRAEGTGPTRPQLGQLDMFSDRGDQLIVDLIAPNSEDDSLLQSEAEKHDLLPPEGDDLVPEEVMLEP